MERIKKLWPWLLALAVFATVSIIYMSPELDGKVIATTDGIQARAAVHESVEYHEQTGERTWWNGAMFSGMPNFQIGGGRYMADTWMRPLILLTHYGHGTHPIGIVLIYCICFFVLMLSMRVNRWLAVVGALAMAFSSYFFIIIGAGHNSKTSTLALMAAVIAGFYLIYNGHRKTGVVLTMLCTAMGMYPHPQMAYYMCFIIGFFFLAELWQAARTRAWRAFGISTAIFAGSFLVGYGTGTAATLANMEYARETMRGGHSDLVKEKDGANKTEGLDLDYATAWSYGIDETWTFLVPDYMGGSSHYNVGADSELCAAMVKRGVPRKAAEQFCEAVPTYWGDQPFTAGPVYMGAVVCFLFVLGLCLVKGPYKWALLAATVLSVCLSWGHNWMWLTRLFFDTVPMYNKFRAVSSILVIAEVTMPLLGFLALRQLAERKVERQAALRGVYAAAGVTGGLCLVLALFGPSFLDFSSPQDERYFGGQNAWLIPLLEAQRASMLTGDAWRSLLFVLAAAALTWFYAGTDRLKTPVFAVALGALVLLDMWPVNKRYMNDSMFSTPKNFDAAFAMQPYEKIILQDPDPHFRVFNLAANTFNDARTSYRLQSIGGYHAAKLRRYQDLIDEHLSKMHMPVINMLNTKYIIHQTQDRGVVPQLNPAAFGNAWFVDTLVVVDGANAESDALGTLDLRHAAVLDREFEPLAGNLTPGPDSTAAVTLVSHEPGRVEYETTASRPGTVVFSEVYYPHGWKVTVDGEPADHFRADYILRAMSVPAGQHRIRFEFRPDSVATGNAIAMTCVIIMYLTVLVLIALGIRQSLKQ